MQRILADDVREFVRIFPAEERSEEEAAMIRRIGDQDFFIGLLKSDASDDLVMHELSHVLYYYDKEYKEAVNRLWASLPEDAREEITTKLSGRGYEPVEIVDEFFAHLFCGFSRTEEILKAHPQIEALSRETVRRFSRAVSCA